MDSKKHFGEEAANFVRYCLDQGVARDRIATALIQLGFEARAVSAALEPELPRPAEGQDDMQALAALTMTMHTPVWRVSLASAKSAAASAVAAMRLKLPPGTRAYVHSALAVSAAVLALGWATASWLIQPPGNGRTHATAQAKINPPGTRLAQTEQRHKAVAHKKRQFTFWALPGRD